jgi:hypothetical protein
MIHGLLIIDTSDAWDVLLPVAFNHVSNIDFTYMMNGFSPYLMVFVSRGVDSCVDAFVVTFMRMMQTVDLLVQNACPVASATSPASVLEMI